MKNKYTLITGTGDFKDLISSNGLSVDSSRLFVDKTLFIKDFLECGAKVLLITRPRRWGKTLALSMLQYFFSEIIDGQPTAGLFQGLKIEKYLEEENPDLKKYQGAHPVISISFKDLKGDSFEEIEKNIIEKISKLFKSFEFLETELNNKNIKLGSESTCKSNANIFLGIKKKEADFSEVTTSLLFLSELLYKYHGKKVIVLIDEYDNAINNSYNQPEVVDKLTTFFGNMFGACLKDNKYLEKGLVTGVLRIAKSGMFSGLNNLLEISMLDNRFSDNYGFTETEVFELLRKADLNNFEEVQNWYNGYTVGKNKLYNPWSITQLILNNGVLQPYWVDTANPKMLRNILLDNSISEERIKIGDLLRNNELILPNEINSQISMEDLNSNVEAMWSLMLHAGYLTLIEKKNYFKVRLPNLEIKNLIQKDINNWFTENKIFSDAANALLTGNIEGFREALTESLLNSAYSSRILGGGGSAARAPESVSAKEFMYQFLVMAELRCINLGTTEDYEVIAEPQAISLGQTRPDFIVLHHKHKFCIVGEIKITNRKETIESAAERAMAQINKNKYGQKYVDLGYKLIKIGISFLGAEFEMIWEE